MSGKPLVSVVMPVYNQEKYIAAAVRSILQQTFADFEFVIVDDGSTDKTVSLIKEFADKRIRLIEAKHGGFLAALETGLSAASGKWIARMDSDDICHPQRLEKQMSFLEHNPQSLFVTSIYGIVTPHNRYLKPLETFDFRQISAPDITLATCLFCDPATVFNREKALKVGYDKSWENEKPLWYKLLENGEGYVLGEAIYYIRWLLGSHSRSESGKRSSANDLIRAKYDSNAFQKPPRENFDATKKRFNVAGKCLNYYLAADDFAAAQTVANQLLKEFPFHLNTLKMATRAFGHINADVKKNLKRAKFAFAKTEKPWL